jgi:hypothetical protein
VIAQSDLRDLRFSIRATPGGHSPKSQVTPTVRT